MLPVQIREVRKLYKNSQQNDGIGKLLNGIEAMRGAVGALQNSLGTESKRLAAKLTREDLRLICFEVDAK